MLGALCFECTLRLGKGDDLGSLTPVRPQLSSPYCSRPRGKIFTVIWDFHGHTVFTVQSWPAELATARQATRADYFSVRDKRNYAARKRQQRAINRMKRRRDDAPRVPGRACP